MVKTDFILVVVETCFKGLRSQTPEKYLVLQYFVSLLVFLRCFSAWKEAVELKAYYKSSLMHLRVESMRKYFQQWFRMLQVRESNKQAMVNLLFLRWRQHYGECHGACI